MLTAAAAVNEHGSPIRERSCDSIRRVGRRRAVALETTLVQ